MRGHGPPPRVWDSPQDWLEHYAAPVPECGCWLFQGRLNSGYGRVYVRGKMIGAHRVSYELFKGPLPIGMQALHHCDVKSCINPNHLYAGTRLENAQDALKRNRNWWATKTVCKQGHPYSRVIVKADGSKVRECATCRKKWTAKRYGRGNRV